MTRFFIIIVSILSGVLLLAGGQTVAAAEETLPAPAIAISPDIYYPFEEILYLEGTAPTAATVQLRLQKSGARPLTYTIKAQANGEWALAEKVPLAAGEWEARARVVAGSQNSDWSNPRIFKVVISGITVGGLRVKFATLTLFIILLIVVGGLLITFYSLRIRKLKKALLSKEVHEAQESVRSNLAELKQDLFEELKLLQSDRRLSAEKLARKEHLLRELDRIEREIDREIGDIEKH